MMLCEGGHERDRNHRGQLCLRCIDDATGTLVCASAVCAGRICGCGCKHDHWTQPSHGGSGAEYPEATRRRPARVDAERVFPGFTLFAPHFVESRAVYLIDTRGEIVHSWSLPYPPGLS